jgi:SNF2 family DNA or RNA helicase
VSGQLVQGLGKTVEAIATCILNPSNDPSEKTTLVLAPLALLQQWKNEIEEKVEKDYVSVLIYHGEPLI